MAVLDPFAWQKSSFTLLHCFVRKKVRLLSTAITLMASQSQESANKYSVVVLKMKVMGMNAPSLIFLASVQ